MNTTQVVFETPLDGACCVKRRFVSLATSAHRRAAACAGRPCACGQHRRAPCNQKNREASAKVCFKHNIKMFAQLLDIDLQTDYATPYETNRAAYLADAEALKKATGPYKAARDAYVAATATFTKSLYE